MKEMMKNNCMRLPLKYASKHFPPHVRISQVKVLLNSQLCNKIICGWPPRSGNMSPENMIN